MKSEVIDQNGLNRVYVANCSAGKIYFRVPEKEAENIPLEESSQLLIRWME